MKSLRRWIASWSAALVLPFALRLPATAAEPDAGGWTITPAVTSQYLFRGVRLAGPSVQPGVEYARGPLIAGLWANCPLQDEGAGTTLWELDLYSSYTWPLIADRLDVVAGAVAYSYPATHRSEGAYPVTVEPSVAFNCTAAGIRFTPKLYYDIMLEATTAELSAAFAFALKDLGTELDFVVTAGTYRAGTVLAGMDPPVRNWGDYWQAGVSLPYQVTANSKLTLGLMYSDGRNNYFKAGTEPKFPNELAVRRLAVTLSYSVGL